MRLSMLPFPRKQRGESLSRRSSLPRPRSISIATNRSRVFCFPRAELHHLLTARGRHIVPAHLYTRQQNEMARQTGARPVQDKKQCAVATPSNEVFYIASVRDRPRCSGIYIPMVPGFDRRKFSPSKIVSCVRRLTLISHEGPLLTHAAKPTTRSLYCRFLSFRYLRKG